MKYKNVVKEIYPNAFCQRDEDGCGYHIFKEKPTVVGNILGLGRTAHWAWVDASFNVKLSQKDQRPKIK